MFFKCLRNFHLARNLWSTDKSNLAVLRKDTGYTFANCRKALEMHNNDLEKAKEWLNQQAHAMGWAKATKLSGRTTSQGLIALKYDEQHAALVEINCETDFVSKNEKFHKMAEETADACYKFAHSAAQAKGLLTKMCLDSERLGLLHSAGGKTLAEQLVLMIGFVGENSVLRRAECWKATSGLHLSGYTHPPSTSSTTFSSGKYGAILAYTCDSVTEETKNIARQLCQHIVGMKPHKVGKEDVDKPAEDIDEETCLIYQEYIANPTLLVIDVLKEHKIHISDFIRFECGENLDANIASNQQPLDNVQTCQ